MWVSHASVLEMPSKVYAVTGTYVSTIATNKEILVLSGHTILS